MMSRFCAWQALMGWYCGFGIAVTLFAGRSAAQETHSVALDSNAVPTGAMLSQWRDLTTPMQRASSAVPAAVEDCALIYDPIAHALVLFGGKNDQNENLNEVWALDLNTDVWQKFAVAGDSPPASEDHVVLYDPLSHRMILHGGENGGTWNNTWSFDLKTHRWRDLTPQSGAPRREDHTAVFDRHGKRMVIFGGRDNERKHLYEMWAFDLNPHSTRFETWKNLTVEENHPGARVDHTAVYDLKRNRMVIYGGWDKENNECLDDTWFFFFANRSDSAGKWRELKTRREHPPRRRQAVGVHDEARNLFIICGGYGDKGYLNDVWAFDLQSNTWINITPGPRPRQDHQAIYDPRSQRMLLWGGDAHLPNKFHDLWELAITPDWSLDSLRRKVAPKISSK